MKFHKMNWDDRSVVFQLVAQIISLNKLRLYWKVTGKKSKEEEVKKLLKKNEIDNAKFFRMFVSFSESKRAEKMFEYLKTVMEEDEAKK